MQGTKLGRQGGFALIYTLVVLTLMLLFAGLATDSLRAYLVKAQLTKGVDGAALGAARMLNGGDPAGQARSLFRRNFPDGYMGTAYGADPAAAPNFYSLTIDEPNGVNIVDITATIDMPTMLMSLANINTVTVRGTAQATRRMVDLSLCLDVSGSIGPAWPAVRDAARTFAQAFDPNSDRFSLTLFSSGTEVVVPMNAGRGFNQSAVVNGIPQTLPAGGTAMAEALFRCWDELAAVPLGQQSSLRVIVLFTDGAPNFIPGVFDASPGSVKQIGTSSFPRQGSIGSDNPGIFGLYHSETGVRSPAYYVSYPWTSTSTHSQMQWLPVESSHPYGRSGVIPTTFPWETNTLTVNGATQSAVRGLRNFNPGMGRYPAEIWNIGNASRNLVEMIADGARSDLGGDYRIRIYTIGMAEAIQLGFGTLQEPSEEILQRVANDIVSQDYDATQLEGGYFYAATAADVGPAFQELQNQIIRLTQ